MSHEMSRAEMAAAVAKLTSTAEWRQEHPGRRQTVITVRPDDSVAYVLRQLADTIPGTAVFLATVTDTDTRVVKLSEERWSLSLNRMHVDVG